MLDVGPTSSRERSPCLHFTLEDEGNFLKSAPETPALAARLTCTVTAQTREPHCAPDRNALRASAKVAPRSPGREELLEAPLPAGKESERMGTTSLGTVAQGAGMGAQDLPSVSFSSFQKAA